MHSASLSYQQTIFEFEFNNYLTSSFKYGGLTSTPFQIFWGHVCLILI